MGLFSRKNRDQATQPRAADEVVLCAFRDLTNRTPLRNFDPEHSYAYRWQVPVPPAVGMWALVDGHDGASTVVVGHVGANEYVRANGAAALESIRRLVPEAQLRRAATAAGVVDAALTQWLDHCSQLAGLRSNSTPIVVPPGFDAPKRLHATADAETADANGATWWRAYKKAEETGRGADAARFKTLAQDWYRERDQKAKAAQLAGVSQVAARGGLVAAIEAVVSGKDLGDKPGEFLGQPMWDWLRYAEAQAKHASSNDEDALALVYALIEVAEREALVSGREPAPAYTERAAILHRKRKDYASEVAVIERWERACPPEKRGPGAVQAKLAARLVKARSLADTEALL